ncbi:polysaccharide pyruvyl transferase family protein [Paucibacter sp. XJ19-41]|uniref:polysaccharide pyruvyl transferase family protein n=1 Tax=Paucibacter sp. XJ19-41 TaxID=2927824 RepID=UPI00234A9739|nr:polysaccharide pyruvyl transferase family protein [Paucibacter sp. XJ19-41]MDC6166640.1 polysaccharide pyruvyl transferase family protein [Paucibacter sp. XJ19-41]
MSTNNKSAPKRRVTVGLMWHSLGSGNLGVGALTESNIAIVRGVAEKLGLALRFVVLGTSDAGVPELAAELRAAGHELEVTRIRVFRREFREAVRRCDLVLDIGEGDSFADIYGLKRFMFYWLSKNIVCLLGKPLILSPQTIGPFDGAIARILAQQVMRRCARVFARDNLSTAYLKQLGISGNVDEAIDVAFRLPFIRPARPADGRVRVGINVSGLLFNGGYTGNNQFGLSIDYAATLRALLADLSARPEVEVHLVSHVIEPHMPIEDDVHAAKILATEFPGVILSPVFTRPSEAKSYIAGMDFFTGARMHACIAAFSTGVPVVPMAYSRKFNGLFGTLGYAHVADCKVESQVQVLKRIDDALRAREQVKQQVDVALQLVAERITRYEDVLARALVKG